MEELYKVGIDIGQSRIKYIYKDKEEAYQYGYIANRYELGETLSTSGYIVTRKDLNYIVELGGIEGIPNNGNNKINTEHLNDFILVIASKIKNTYKLSDNTRINLHINTLLPPNQFQSKGQAFKEIIENYGEYEGVIDNHLVKVGIKKVGVYCEGVQQLLILDFSMLENEDNALILDVGGNTIDVVQIQKINDNWTIAKALSTNKLSGSIILKEIEKGLNKKYPSKIYEYDQLEKDFYYYYNRKKHSVLNEIEYANDKISKINKLVFTDNDKGGQIILTGGGAKLLNASPMFQKICKDRELIPLLMDEFNQVYGNCKGAYLV